MGAILRDLKSEGVSILVAESNVHHVDQRTFVLESLYYTFWGCPNDTKYRLLCLSFRLRVGMSEELMNEVVSGQLDAALVADHVAVPPTLR